MPNHTDHPTAMPPFGDTRRGLIDCIEALLERNAELARHLDDSITLLNRLARQIRRRQQQDGRRPPLELLLHLQDQEAEPLRLALQWRTRVRRLLEDDPGDWRIDAHLTTGACCPTAAPAHHPAAESITAALWCRCQDRPHGGA